MARPRAIPDLHLLSKVSTLYYLREETQQQIADRLGISRPTVSRLLRDARAHDIVRISVATPSGLHIEVEQALETRFGLSEAYIVPVGPGDTSEIVQRQLGAAAAAYLERTVLPNQSIGLAWGTTLNAMVQVVAPSLTHNVSIVQMLGGVGPPDAEAYASGLVRRLAQALNAAPVILPAPGIVATSKVRNALREDPHVNAALQHFDSLDAAFVGIGSLRSNVVLADTQSLPSGVRRELIAAGAVGDIALRFFDANGDHVGLAFDDCILGITLAQLRKVPRTVAVAGGVEKVDAIRAALTARLVDVLITDHETATQLVGRPA